MTKSSHELGEKGGSGQARLACMRANKSFITNFQYILIYLDIYPRTLHIPYSNLLNTPLAHHSFQVFMALAHDFAASLTVCPPFNLPFILLLPGIYYSFFKAQFKCYTFYETVGTVRDPFPHLNLFQHVLWSHFLPSLDLKLFVDRDSVLFISYP